MDNWACVEAAISCCEAAVAHAQSLVGLVGGGVATLLLLREMEPAKIVLEVVSESNVDDSVTHNINAQLIKFAFQGARLVVHCRRQHSVASLA